MTEISKTVMPELPKDITALMKLKNDVNYKALWPQIDMAIELIKNDKNQELENEIPPSKDTLSEGTTSMPDLLSLIPEGVDLGSMIGGLGYLDNIPDIIQSIDTLSTIMENGLQQILTTQKMVINRLDDITKDNNILTQKQEQTTDTSQSVPTKQVVG